MGFFAFVLETHFIPVIGFHFLFDFVLKIWDNLILGALEFLFMCPPSLVQKSRSTLHFFHFKKRSLLKLRHLKAWALLFENPLRILKLF